MKGYRIAGTLSSMITSYVTMTIALDKLEGQPPLAYIFAFMGVVLFGVVVGAIVELIVFALDNHDDL